MDKQSQLKVAREGFMIIRKDDTPNIRIKYIDCKQHDWATYAKPFETKASRDRAFNKLLELPHVIND
jgi:hypothetical protein